MHRGRKDRLASLSSGLAMAVLLGTLLGIPFWLLGLLRVIRISGYRLEFRRPYRIVGARFDEETEKRRLELAILTPKVPA